MAIYNRFNIVTKQREDDWVACIANNLNEYATGNTEQEAIGNLIVFLGENDIDDTQKDMGRLTFFKSQRYSGS